MGVSLLSQLGMTSGNNKYFDDATKQVILFSDRMFNRELGLFAHGWGKDAPLRPKFYWGRANGWAFMAMIELLNVLPESHKNKETILGLFIAHLTGITRLQSKSGLWHQLLDKNDSYTESSASAIIIYCIAKAINRGYISAIDYGPMVILAWNALCKRINEKGHIEGICVGTGMGFESVFYYHRPVSIYAAHGYGPTILAGIELIQLIEKHRIENHDGALVFDFVKHE
jgi:rhamnogalacturonyl hydrolase YesR